MIAKQLLSELTNNINISKSEAEQTKARLNLGLSSLVVVKQGDTRYPPSQKIRGIESCFDISG